MTPTVMYEKDDTINGTKYHHSTEYNDLKDDDNKLKEFFQLQIDALKESTSREDANLKEAYLLAVKLISEHQIASNNLQELIRKQTIDHDKQFELKLSTIEYERRHNQIIESNEKSHTIFYEKMKDFEIFRATLSAKADQKTVDDKFQFTQRTTNRLLIFTIVSMAIALLSLALDFFINY